MSRSTRSGRSSSITLTASEPVAASPTTSIDSSAASHATSCRRCAASSSTTTTRSLVSASLIERDRQSHRDLEAASRRRFDHSTTVFTEAKPQPLAKHGKTNPARRSDTRGIRAVAVVRDAEHPSGPVSSRGDREVSPVRAAGQPVSNRVLHQRLKEKTRDHEWERLRIDVLADSQSIAEPEPLERQILARVGELVGERDAIGVFTARVNAAPQQMREMLQRRMDF